MRTRAGRPRLARLSGQHAHALDHPRPAPTRGSAGSRATSASPTRSQRPGERREVVDGEPALARLEPAERRRRHPRRVRHGLERQPALLAQRAQTESYAFLVGCQFSKGACHIGSRPATVTSMDTDVVVIGGGSAGLQAALTLGRMRFDVVVVDAGHPSNAPAHAIGGLLGAHDVSPLDLLATGRAQLAELPSVRLIEGEATRVDASHDVTLADDTVLAARAVVLATGMDYGFPAIPGMDGLWGNAVIHCPFCHGWEARDARIGLLAAGEEHARPSRPAPAPPVRRRRGLRGRRRPAVDRGRPGGRPPARRLRDAARRPLRRRAAHAPRRRVRPPAARTHGPRARRDGRVRPDVASRASTPPAISSPWRPPSSRRSPPPSGRRSASPGTFLERRDRRTLATGAAPAVGSAGEPRARRRRVAARRVRPGARAEREDARGARRRRARRRVLAELDARQARRVARRPRRVLAHDHGQRRLERRPVEHGPAGHAARRPPGRSSPASSSASTSRSSSPGRRTTASPTPR